MLECNVFGLKETKKNGSLSCEVVDLRKIRAISGVSRAKITRKSIVHSRKICELTTCPMKQATACSLRALRCSVRGEASRGSCLAAHPTGSFEATDKVPYASTKAAKSIEEDIIPFKVIKRCFVLKSSQKAMLVSYFAHGGQGTVPKAIICTKCFFTD